ncbi:MAG: GNAT family N-acetyltransferase [Gemmatimonadetes bacterium]|nr:GNAT family N-acetyltransferase [Gemmatimonadota bacterium]
MISRPTERDIPAIVALNNMFAPEGKTLLRTPQFVEEHLADYLVLRDENSRVVGCVALDEYSPSLVELVGLAVHPSVRGRGYGIMLIEEIADLARRRGYDEMFATSFSEAIFESCGFLKEKLDEFPEKVLRYTRIDRTEVEMSEKHCFSRVLRQTSQPAG